ncbi:MAG: 3-dehydroquinate synthase [Rubrivivax sp.]
MSLHLPAGTVTVPVTVPGHRYDILIGHGLLDSDAAWQGLPSATQAVIVTNTTVGPLFAQQLQQRLASTHRETSVLELPDGEAHKDWPTLNLVFDHLLQRGCDRKCVLYALGGGVVGDMTGFAAACYMRGVHFVQVPTTLLAQVDSSVGGKTAINHPLGKNMIGAFYQPERVICDLDTLGSLPAREFAAGLAEVIKYGPIFDLPFMDWIEQRLDALLARQPADLVHAVARSCQIKAQVVGADERESGLRAILNFGHTFGHAIEAALGYGQWLHGEAVACGMVMATELSASLGLVPDDAVQRLLRLLQRARLPVRAPAIALDRFLDLMRVDKKAEAGEIRFVLVDGQGRAVVRPAPEAQVRAAIARHMST